MSWLMTSVTLALSILITGVIVEWIARMRHPSRLFFMSLGRERNDADDARARRLRIVNGVATAVGVGLVCTPVPELVRVGAVTICPLVSTTWLIVEMIGAARSVKLERVPGRYVVSLDDAPGVAEYISVPLQLANVLTLLVPSAIFAWVLSRLPESVPMHWNASGAVDRYGSPSELWMMAGLVAFDLLLLWGMTWAVAKEKWALPEKETLRYAQLQLERRRLMVRMLEWIMLGVNVGMVVIWMAIALGGFPGWHGIEGPAVVLSVVIMTLAPILPLVIGVPRLLRVADEMKKIAGTEVLGTHHDGWRWGGMIYFAPKDAAVFVPKRIGIGQTLNFARPAAWIFLAAVILVPLAIALVATLSAA
jgi:uncharacterized membrane protein